MLSKDALNAMADKYQAKADAAYEKYQDTGAQRYNNEQWRNEELADALRVAANAAEEHNLMIAYRADLTRLAQMAEQATEQNDQALLKQLATETVGYGQMHGLIRRDA